MFIFLNSGTQNMRVLAGIEIDCTFLAPGHAFYHNLENLSFSFFKKIHQSIEKQLPDHVS